MAKRFDFKGIELGRTIGIEIEGYSKDARRMINTGVRHSDIKRDASLSNSYGWGVDYNTSVGLEVVSQPLSKLDILDDIFEDIKKYKWNVGRGRASTHVHVDISDYKLIDQIKMSSFMQKLESLMFLMVKPNRYSINGHRNRYCRPLDTKWSKVLEYIESRGIDISRANNMRELAFIMSRREDGSMHRDAYQSIPQFNRYNFVNVFETHKGTIEFRLFHSIRDSKEAKKFGLIAYNIIETVKHSTVEQLDFIANSVNNMSSAEEMVQKFAESIGLEFTPKIFNTILRDEINNAKSTEVAV